MPPSRTETISRDSYPLPKLGTSDVSVSVITSEIKSLEKPLLGLAQNDNQVTHVDGQDDDDSVITERILAVIKTILLTKLPGAHDRWDQGVTSFLAVIRLFVEKRQTVKMCLPAFPWKSANKVEKVLGILPDKAEEVALKRLNGICEAIGQFYKPGAELLIISDGLVYNDLLTIPDRDTWAYGEALRIMAEELPCRHIKFTRLKDLVTIPNLPETIDEVTYISNASNFRRAFLNEFANPDFDASKEIAEKEDTRMTYNGYCRFLRNDLRYIFHRGENRSGMQYKRDIKYIAKQMIIRGDAFARAVKHNFPTHLRLSIHQSTGEHKISISLLPTSTSYTTPWHCSVAYRTDGTLISRPKVEFEDDIAYELVWENGRPSYYREKEGDLEREDDWENSDTAAN
ncbi:hypothetical protein QQS21_001900 [Conoideocrella luteorostrata]|uniref:Pyoverdine biosynthesis n=1 Tax=Conoideocrella luteorostrata TaxID=1105319 RepID=A0AAJ0CW26_9HYPO|nr:hypothetical protein QQS21_001900 [Conoideocrella luteorostrata]